MYVCMYIYVCRYTHIDLCMYICIYVHLYYLIKTYCPSHCHNSLMETGALGQHPCTVTCCWYS